MGAKKKRDYNAFSGKRSNTNLGTIYDHNIKRNSLPPVGSFVIVMEETDYWKCRFYGGIKTYYKPCTSSAYTDAYGNIYVFEVTEYSRGIDNIFDPLNQVMLTHYYGGDRDRGAMRMSVRAIDVTVGTLRLDIVDGKDIGVLDPLIFDDKEKYAISMGAYSER